MKPLFDKILKHSDALGEGGSGKVCGARSHLEKYKEGGIAKDILNYFGDKKATLSHIKFRFYIREN